MSERKRMRCPETSALQEVELDPLDEAIADHRERVLVVLANLDDDAARIAAMLIEDLAADGLTVELAALAGGAVPPVADYDAVVVGTHVRLGRPARAVVTYIRDHLDELDGGTSFFFSVGGRGRIDRDLGAGRVSECTGWQPTLSWAFTDSTDLRSVEVRAFARLVADEIPAVAYASLA
jgi:hypothetical protein